MQREQSHITLSRPLVRDYGHFPAMVLDCLRNRIEHHLATEAEDGKFFRVQDGLMYVNAGGTFISNWIMCDPSTANNALRKLTKKGLLKQAFLNGNNKGAWYAFTDKFIGVYKGFFDDAAAAYLRSIYDDSKGQLTCEIAPDLSAGGSTSREDNIPTKQGDDSTSREDNILTGKDIIPAGEDNILTGPIYNTNTTKNHLPWGDDGGGSVLDFLGERDEPFLDEITLTLQSYFDDDFVQLIKDQLGWKTCKKTTARQLKNLVQDYGFEIYASAVVMAAGEMHLGNPLSFLRAVCKRLNDQRQDNQRRRPQQKKTRLAPPLSQRPVVEILGGAATDPSTWARHAG